MASQLRSGLSTNKVHQMAEFCSIIREAHAHNAQMWMSMRKVRI